MSDVPSLGRAGDWFSRAARRGLHERLARIHTGQLDLVDAEASTSFGPGGMAATIRVHDPAFYRAVALRGALGAAEAYMDRHWSSDDLTGVIRILAINRDAFHGLGEGTARWAELPLRVWHWLHRNSPSGSRRNIAAHYDLGNEFFELFLDPTLTYSCGIFERPDMTMEEASIAKYDRACRKLGLSPKDHVLEIGSGWGGFAIHAAGRYGCRVTGVTISREQHELAQRRVAEAGLSEQVEIRFQDYRDISERFDKLVSIEMIEAVGADHLDGFFRVCSDRLAPDGAMLLQAITTQERDYETSRRSVDFVKRYIFPGGQLVSVGAISRALAAATDLRFGHLEDLTPFYAETLKRWRSRMFENLAEIRALGLPDRFLAMWEYYLCYCEGAFQEREIGVVQVVLEKPRARRAPILGDLPA